MENNLILFGPGSLAIDPNGKRERLARKIERRRPRQRETLVHRSLGNVERQRLAGLAGGQDYRGSSLEGLPTGRGPNCRACRNTMPSMISSNLYQARTLNRRAGGIDRTNRSEEARIRLIGKKMFLDAHCLIFCQPDGFQDMAAGISTLNLNPAVEHMRLGDACLLHFHAELGAQVGDDGGGSLIVNSG